MLNWSEVASAKNQAQFPNRCVLGCTRELRLRRGKSYATYMSIGIDAAVAGGRKRRTEI